MNIYFFIQFGMPVALVYLSEFDRTYFNHSFFGEYTMKNVNAIVHSALAAAITLSAVGAQTPVFAAEKPDVEKCYGVAKAGKNDCKTLSNACAGLSLTDAQADAFIALPKGTCDRIVGGSLQAPEKDK
jgi:uncharacterized membrane protein